MHYSVTFTSPYSWKIRKSFQRFLERMYSFLLPLVAMILLLSACSTDDYYDICCDDLCIDFRYSRGAKDVFPEYIKNMRHFLFSAEGRFLKEIEADKSHLQHLHIEHIEEGSYKIVTLGNSSAVSHLSALVPKQTNLDDFLLTISNQRSDDKQNDSDPLYWGVCSFLYKRNTTQRYLCDMSNIHCLLTVSVVWKDTQPQADDFIMQIRGVSGTYNLSPEHSSVQYVLGDNLQSIPTIDRVVHRFPYVYEDISRLVVHRKEVPRLAGRVKATIRSLRYTDTSVPYFQLLNMDGTPAMREIHLLKPFKEWGWKISDNIEQNYEIEIALYDDGKIVVRPGGEANILDWIDGGIVG